MQKVLINILTRTSSRPSGFKLCYDSIKNQSYKNFEHIVSYEVNDSLNYLKNKDLLLIKVNKISKLDQRNKQGLIHAPYNLYCNELLNRVKDGWIMFLDDDDNLLHNNVFEELVEHIKTIDEDTLIIWKMRYPNGKVIPSKVSIDNSEILMNDIGSCCFMFHSKYRNSAKWDEWKGSDFRFLKQLETIVPKQKWINKVYIQINNFGDFGNQNDISNNLNPIIYKKNWMWYFIPKYHTKVLGFKLFDLSSYKMIVNKIKKRICYH
jgi:hypothetical protein